ncbi:MAG: 4-hydroxy-tetrahydrodipicolinate reductase [Bdellovibrionaceae bacterium]|nr:4-hydroxy-tetrahydrodipicolinate reductase [Pseudobdellovibrionaceae bacterium]
MKKKLKVGVFGACGRMGHEVSSLLAVSNELTPQVGVDRVMAGKHPFKKFSTKMTPEVAHEADVWIDFSAAEAMEDILSACLRAKKPLVSGSTGLSKKQELNLKKAARKIPILWSPNMSLGIALLRKMTRTLTLMPGADFSIYEIHHRKKKDRPSGTALRLAEDLLALTGHQPEIAVSRLGGVFGVHEVSAATADEVITLKHTALNRTVFAQGAVTAALWIATKKEGLYSIEDVLNLRSS